MTREPTEAEYRALAELEKQLQARGMDHDTQGWNHQDMLAVVRTVIRSLREPAVEIVGAIQHHPTPLMVGTSISGWWKHVIDAASPEIKS